MSKIKQKLLSLQEELNSRVSKIEKDLHSRKTSQKFSEQSVDRQNDDVLLNLKNEAEEELEQINNALLKLERNIYGKCEKCHEEISKERINVLPFTPYCKNCAI
jgi:RNA polymerase-binding transcription factor